MKLCRFLVPKSENSSAKRLIIKKLFSTILVSAAFSGLTLNVAGDLPSTINDGAQSDVVSSVPLGLSRRRPAFRKAIGMLSDAAAANPHLADYYNCLEKRVKGDAVKGEDSSGIRAVESSCKSHHAVRDTATLNGAASTNTPAEGMIAPPGAAVRRPNNSLSSSAATDDSSSQVGVASSTISRFTVGDMAFDANAPIEHWMNYYTTTPIGRRTMRIGIERSYSYLEMARAEFRSAGVPEDLVWLAFVESVWNPRAVSPAAAGGIWQFISSTATDYGLTVESGNDERADPSKQTHIAAIYLHDLYTVFGDWALAMAAYNSGEPRVMGAIVKNGRANFWDLYEKQLLPKETRDYVPKILAAIKIAGGAENYGLTPQTETVGSTGS